MALVVLCVLSLASCKEKTKMPADLLFDVETQTLHWNKNSAAYGYTIEISGVEGVKSTKHNYISLEFLDAGTYEVKVKALGDQVTTEDSEWATYTIERPEETGLKYKLINNDTEYELIGVGTAYGDVVMESVFRNKPVTSIADKALSNNSKITSFVVGDNVKTIGKNAFSRSRELTSIIIPEGVTSIGEYAFQSCKKLEKIALPNTVTEISPYMFSWCNALTEVKFGNAVTSVSEYAFSNCEALTAVDMPSTVVSIGEYAFSDCPAVTSINLGGSVRDIGGYAFYNCKSLTEIDLGNKLINLGEFAFGNCSKIETVVVPDSTNVIGQAAFNGCSALTNVTFGNNLTSVGLGVFFGTKLYEDATGLLTIGGWVIEAKDKTITTIELPTGIYGIADYAFYNCDALMSVTLHGIKHVGKNSFGYCDKLWEIIFDDTLLTLDSYAFNYCTKLTDVTVGSNLERIGNYTFYGCSMLQNSIDLPDSLTYIGTQSFVETWAFKSAADVVYIDNWAVGLKPSIYTNVIIKDGTRGIANYSLTSAMAVHSIEMPNTVEYIGEGAFYNCSWTPLIVLSENLKEIGDYAFYGCTNAWFGDEGITTIPTGTESIGKAAFYNCVKMVGLTIPGTVKTIGDFAFFNCVNLGHSQLYYQDAPDVLLVGDVILGEGIEHIGAKAFQNCAGLYEIKIPNSVVTMGDKAFYRCTGLTKLTLGNSLIAIPDYAFYDCAAIDNLNLPESVTDIGKYAFRGCKAIKSLDIGKNVKSIGKFAFYGCSSITELVIPETLVSIDNFAFRACSSVTSVIIPETLEKIGKHAFNGMKDATIYCESAEINPYWDELWNTSLCTTFWACELSEDKSFVVSIAKSATTLSNDMEYTEFADPVREGYTFGGWATEAGSKTAAYTSSTVITAPDGTILYAIWDGNTTN